VTEYRVRSGAIYTMTRKKRRSGNEEFPKGEKKKNEKMDKNIFESDVCTGRAHAMKGGGVGEEAKLKAVQ